MEDVKSDLEKEKKKKSPIPIRLNVLFFAVFMLFSILILRLGELQIVYGDDYKREIERTEDVTVNNPVPRGKMYDRTGKVMVDNTPLNAITYTQGKNVSQDEMVKTAEKLSKLIQVDYFKRDKNTGEVKKDQKTGKALIDVPVRDMKDFWIYKHPNEAKAKVTKKEQKKLDNKEIYQLQLKRITDEELASFTPDELKVLWIYDQFLKGYALTPQIVKRNVPPDEFAKVSENLDKLPGIDTTTDWDRVYPFQETLKTVLGNVTSAEEGIPKEQADQYLAKGYSRNDRVGKSYLEMEYEDVLQGQKAKVNNITDKDGNVLSTAVVSDGKRGNDLVLTIDMDLQKQTEAIIEDELKSAKTKYSNTGLLDRAFVVVMNPHTGEVLTMAGKQIVKNPETGQLETKDFALGNITTSYNVGSAVKGATVLTGYKTGAIYPGEKQVDEPIRIASTPVKKSWTILGTLDDLRALQYSSNVYMFKTVIAMGHGHYIPNGPLPLDPKTWNTMRQSFAQFGLGSRTGIDLPNESTGYIGQEKLPGKLLDLAIGQYDTYTPMQLAQYVSTIANDGYRVQPHLVKEIRQPVLENRDQLGPIIQEIEPKILNKINMQDDWIKRVQQGFKLVMQVPGGTAYTYFKSANYDPSGKTGTAQALYDGPESKKLTVDQRQVINLSLVGYAPSENPEIAMAVLVPWVYPDGQKGPNVNEFIGRRVMDAYFNLKKQRASQGTVSENTAQADNQN